MKKIIVKVLVPVLIIGVGFYLYSVYSSPHTSSSAEPYTTPALSKAYTNDAYKFSLKMPESFETREFEGQEGGQTIVLEDLHASSSEPVALS